VARADDILCGQCGERSARDRRFCRRCGASLTAAAQVAAVRPPWWRRLLIRLRLVRATPGRAPTAAEETRPSRRDRVAGTWRRTAVRLGGRGGLLAVLGVVAFVLAVQPVRTALAHHVAGWSQDVHRAIVPSFEPVNARRASATAESPLHPASLTIDGLKNTYWTAPTPGGRLPTLRITFPGYVSFDAIGFTPAAYEDPRQFLAQPRVHELRLTLSNGRTADLAMQNSRDFQPFEVEARGVSYVDIQIRSVFEGQHGDTIALAEVEFFEKR
jgi:hypothetical protein